MIELTIFTSKTSLCKVISRDENGKLVKKAGASLKDGEAERISVGGLVDFWQVRKGLSANQAMAYGVHMGPAKRKVRLDADRSGDEVARTRDHYVFRSGKPGILMLDYDPKAGEQPLDYTALDGVLCAILPGFRDVERVWVPSSSAYIYRKSTGEELSGAKGWHCYAIVNDASRIPAIANFLQYELWERGYGYIALSSSGAMLVRSTFDACVSQPERLDYANAKLVGDLECRAPAPSLIPATNMVLDAAAVDERPDYKTHPKVAEAKKAAKPESDRTGRNFVSKRIEKDVERGVPRRDAEEKWNRLVEEETLGGLFEIHLVDSRIVTVMEVLAHPERFHGVRCADPAEPDYRDDNRIAVIYSDQDRPVIYSHAHGGLIYLLDSRVATIVVAPGEARDTIDASERVLAVLRNLYKRGHGIVEAVEIADPVMGITHHVCPVNEDQVFYLLSGAARYQTYDRKGKLVSIDPPPRIVRASAKRGRVRPGFRELKAVLDAPTILPDGTLLKTPGYHAPSGLLLAGGPFPDIPESPTKMQLEKAYEVFWEPFSEFPFETEHDAIVGLTAALTALVRGALPKAPGFLSTAAATGSSAGKTKLLGIMCLLLGESPTPTPPTKCEDETRKKLFSFLRSGFRTCILDNIQSGYALKSEAFEVFLTSDEFSERPLHTSTIEKLPVRVLTLMTGNDVTLAGDLYTRMLTMRLQPNTEQADTRPFRLKQLEAFVKAKRFELVAAGLTLLRARPEKCVSFSRYEDWTNVVRQPILGLQRDHIIPEGDMLFRSRETKANEPKLKVLRCILDGAEELFGDEPFLASELHERSDELDELVDAFLQMGITNTRELGEYLSANRGTPIDGRWFEDTGKRQQRSVLWRVSRK